MRLVAIHTYPVKGGHRLDHDGAQVEPWGLAGDRRWMVIDEGGVGVTQRELSKLVALRPEPRPGGLVLRTAGQPALDVPEPAGDPVEVRVFRNQPGVPALPAGAPADDWLSSLLDRKVRLVWLARPTRPLPVDAQPYDSGRVSFADVYPLLLANLASVDALNGWLLEQGSLEAPLPVTRFRPNLVISGAAPWAEDDWAARRIRIGSMVFRAAGLCGRCVVTTIDQETGEQGREPLRILAAQRNVNQGLLFGLNLIPEGVGAVAVGDAVRPLP